MFKIAQNHPIGPEARLITSFIINKRAHLTHYRV
jgi:hypothetical protein